MNVHRQHDSVTYDTQQQVSVIYVFLAVGRRRCRGFCSQIPTNDSL